ncbi:hypothetical protein Ddc_14300 [Ditylenchus destructor]|nr:hypothetical protein Ddc_14300 [Ditylenchus destructor]
MLDTENKVGTEEYGQSSAAVPEERPGLFPKKVSQSLPHHSHTHSDTQFASLPPCSKSVSGKGGNPGKGRRDPRRPALEGFGGQKNAKGQESGEMIGRRTEQRKLQTQR